MNETPAVPPATGFDLKIHAFDKSSVFSHVGRPGYMHEAVRKLNGRCVGIRCAIGWLRGCRYDKAIKFRAHRNCTGDSNLIIYESTLCSWLAHCHDTVLLYFTSCTSLWIMLRPFTLHGTFVLIIELVLGKRTTQNVRYVPPFSSFGFKICRIFIRCWMDIRKGNDGTSKCIVTDTHAVS
jgi:hypothetical protein